MHGTKSYAEELILVCQLVPALNQVLVVILEVLGDAGVVFAAVLKEVLLSFNKVVILCCFEAHSLQVVSELIIMHRLNSVDSICYKTVI